MHYQFLSEWSCSIHLTSGATVCYHSFKSHTRNRARSSCSFGTGLISFCKAEKLKSHSLDPTGCLWYVGSKQVENGTEHRFSKLIHTILWCLTSSYVLYVLCVSPNSYKPLQLAPPEIAENFFDCLIFSWWKILYRSLMHYILRVHTKLVCT